jgi:uncharacterized coiled-coil DUF342 family protein
MSDPAGPKIAKLSNPPAADGDAAVQRLQVVAARTARSDLAAKAGANLSSIFVQLVELQQQFGEQILTLEESIQQQRQELVNTMGQLPEMTEKINWLIASFYEQGKKDVTLRERVGRHEASIVNVGKAVRSLCESQARWKGVMDQLADVLAQAKAIPAPAPPEITIG